MRLTRLIAMAAAVACLASAPRAETHVETITEMRLNLFFAAPEAEARALLPAGWEVAPVPGGPAQGATALVVLYDRPMTAGPDGKPLDPSRNRVAVLVVLGRNPATGEAGPVVVGGVSDASGGAPGPYGTFEDGEVTLRMVADGGAETRIEQDWSATAPGGDALKVRAAWTAADPALQPFEQKVYTAAKPGFHRIYRGDQGASVVRSAPMGVDRATRLEVTTAGPRFGALLDADAPLVAVTHLPWYRRATYLP